MSSVGTHTMACCAIALGLLTLPARSINADIAPEAGAKATTNADANHAARPAASVELVAPADVDLAIRADQVVQNGSTREMQLAGSVALTWKNGVQLQARSARIALGSAESHTSSRIFADPLLAAPVELSLPESLELERVVGDSLHLRDDNPRTMRVEGSAALDWSNGFQLRATHARVTLAETGPRRWGRVLIEPLPAAPAAE